MSFGLPRVEFDPPSDFVDEPSGSNGPNWLKIFGIGCGAVLLVGGLLAGLGAFKVVSCCSDVADAGLRAASAERTSTQFGLALQQRDYDAAHDLLGKDYAQSTDPAQLRAMFADHAELIASSQPMVDGADSAEDVQDFDDLTEKTQWRTRIRFYPAPSSSSDEAVVAQLTLNVLEEKKEGARLPISVVTDIEAPRRVPIDYAMEPPSHTVRNLHNDLQAKDYQNAFGRLAQAMKEQGQPEFEAFIDDNAEVFIGSTVTIDRVRYPSDNTAVVQATLKSAEGQTYPVTYDLISELSWRVRGIQPKVSAPAPAHAEDAPAEDAQDAPAQDGDEAEAAEKDAAEAGSDDGAKGPKNPAP